jgi:hypothetical protein
MTANIPSCIHHKTLFWWSNRRIWECRGRAVNTPVSYSGGPGFKSRSGYWLSRGFSWFSSVPKGNCLYGILKLGHDRFLPHPFQTIVHTRISQLYSTLSLKNVAKQTTNKFCSAELVIGGVQGSGPFVACSASVPQFNAKHDTGFRISEKAYIVWQNINVYTECSI